MTFKPLDLNRMPLEGTSLIEASAGTGKTYTIANLYLRLILEKKLEVQQILVVTFTEAATKELRDRIRRNLHAALQAITSPAPVGDEAGVRIATSAAATGSAATVARQLRRALICFDEAAIFTIHGFCKRVLDENAFESAIMFDTELVTDQRRLVQEITDDFWRRHFADTTFFINAVIQRIGLRYDRFVALAERLANNPALTIIPAAAAESAENIARLHAELKSEWQASRETLIAVLHSDKSGFKKNGKPFYGGKLDDWLIKLEKACSDNPSPEDIGSIELFATEHLKGRLKKGFDLPAQRFFDLCQAYCETEQDYAVWLQQHYADYLKSEIARRKQDANIQFFDDLLITVHKALKADGDGLLARTIRAKFAAALIDEFQDTDPIQYDIFRILFARDDRHLFLIGDPKQSIYGFRGADIFAYIQASSQIPDGRRYTLNENWRSESPFVEAVNCFFNPVTNPFALGESIAYTPVQAAVRSLGNRLPLAVAGDRPGNLVLWFINRENSRTDGAAPNKDQARQAAARAVVYEISRLLDRARKGNATLGDRPVRPSDCAVLVTRNADAQLMKERLAEAGIPAVTTRAENIFHTSQARELEQLLTAVAAPGDMVKLHTALASEMIGFPAGTIRAYNEEASGSAELEKHLDRFAAFNDMWQSQGFIRMFRACMLAYDVHGNLLRYPHGERALTNILHLAELIQAAAFENNLGPNGVLNWMRAQRTSAEENEALELRLERDDAAVQILTVFRSKGLQYPIVFCPFMWQPEPAPRGGEIVFHDQGRLFLDIGTEQRNGAHQALALQENLAELVRLLYVALTRAQNRCYLTFGRIGTATVLDYVLTGGARPGNDIYARLKAALKNLDENALFDNVCRAFKDCDNRISLAAPVLESPFPYEPTASDSHFELACRAFERHGSLAGDWMISSFSRLASETPAGRPRSPAQRLQADEFATGPAAPLPAPADSFFAFPGGALTGSCIHAIFETIDFSRPGSRANRVVIDRALNRFGLNEAGPSRGDSVQQMIANVLQAPLRPEAPAFTLERIPSDRRIPEMEFFYPIQRVTAAGLQAVIAEFAEWPAPGKSTFQENLGRLEFKPVRGFMRGFIDLVFKFESRFYLLDWKTNHLGNAYEDYEPLQLAQNMAAARYNLQYYLYTAALHKYLENRIPDYTYASHFGGVFYLFIRGIHPDHPGSGIFYDRPPWDLVQALCKLFGL